MLKDLAKVFGLIVSVGVLIVSSFYYGTITTKNTYDLTVSSQEDIIKKQKDDIKQYKEASKFNISEGIISLSKSIDKLNNISSKLYSQFNGGELEALNISNNQLSEENRSLKKENDILKTKIFEYKIFGKEYLLSANKTIELLGNNFTVSLKSLNEGRAFINATIGDKKIKDMLIEVGDSLPYEDDILRCELKFTEAGTYASFKLYCTPKIKDGGK